MDRRDPFPPYVPTSPNEPVSSTLTHGFRECLHTLEMYSCIYNNLTQGEMATKHATEAAAKLEELMNTLIQSLKPGQIT